MPLPPADQQTLEDEIAHLEQRLQTAKAQLHQRSGIPSIPTLAHDAALHALLLLSDSALPLGSFAFSSGLESYLAHHKALPSSTTPASQLSSFSTFLRLSLATLASTALPYVLAAYRQPGQVERLDNDFDASTPCTVARRASVAQGRALLAVWERSFKGVFQELDLQQGQQRPPNSSSNDIDSNSNSQSQRKTETETEGIKALHNFCANLRTSPLLNAHLAPLWGLVTRVLNLPLHDAAYLFLFSHARTVVSAAVRASVMGPYQAQGVLASPELQGRIRGLVSEGWEREVEDAGQSVPVMDLWVGRHEKLYSRIFNS